MNLYRSFGNLLETWVAEGVPPSHAREEPSWLGRDDDDDDPATVSGGSTTLTPASDMGISVRSESVDSGVELTSSDTSPPSPPYFSVLSTGGPETDPVLKQQEEDGLATSPSTSQTPVLSPPSPSPCNNGPVGAQSSRERSVALHHKVEQALQRTDPRSQSLKQFGPSSPHESVLRRRGTKSSSLVVRHDVTDQEHVASQRSGSLGRKSASQQHTSGHIRRPLSLHHTLPTNIITKNHGDKKKEGLSPGLSYLERVCQMLEEIARLQKDNRGLQLEMDALLESKQSVQASESLFCDCKAIAEEPLSSESCEMNSDEHISTETTQWPNHNVNNHDFRRRSASDTNVLMAHHLRMAKPNSRGQHVDINDLFEQAEDHENLQEETDNQTHRSQLETETQRRDKTASLSDSEKNCQQTQPSQKKKSSRHRGLSQLFRRRRKSIAT